MSKSTALLFILVFAIIFKLEEMVSYNVASFACTSPFESQPLTNSDSGSGVMLQTPTVMPNVHI